MEWNVSARFQRGPGSSALGWRPEKGDAATRPKPSPSTPGQAGDNPQLVPLLGGISAARIGAGPPHCRPETVVADKAYSHSSSRAAMRDRRVRFLSPERDDQTARRVAKSSRSGRPPAFDVEVYKQRNVVERRFNRL
ncbi:transposase [Amycolatopsis mongoliensis]|uniref:Transposase n=1 Tax=Amycolatopsis mongoliensis TaxID=715475 RepID=A0A9Y2NJJ4_9PSEU|nr:transposase [Amycolatopsis sp. 4-36]WIY07592.1 transposase [Amycolatopsis sp. 4-36]